MAKIILARNASGIEYVVALELAKKWQKEHHKNVDIILGRIKVFFKFNSNR